MDMIDGGMVQPPPAFFQNSILERTKDENERKLEKYLQAISKLSGSLSDREAIDALNVHISKGHYEEVQLGLLGMILTSSSHAQKSFNSLTLTNRDGMKCVRDCLFQFTSKWKRLTEQTQSQIVWFTGELLKLGPNPIVHDLVMLLFRNIAPGDLSPRNVWLAEALLRLFTENRASIDRQPFLVDCIVYCYLSIIVDHCHPSVSPALRKAEIDFTVSLLRDKWDDCCGIGRDLIRLLHNVARIPEFESIWHDVLYNPTNLSPSFGGLVPLLRRRTSRRFLLLRITPDLEQKFYFVTSKVRMAGPYLRHLEWLKKSLMAAHGPTLRCELIRYICGLIHPPMETINSDVIQRWYIIGWLLKCHPSAPPADIALAKLAIYFDWLGFDPAFDNVMNIEPGVLLIFHSKPQHSSNLGNVLLDFLCRLATTFHPPAAEDIRLGLLTSFRHLQEKRVLPLASIGLLFDPRHLEQDVFFLCRQTFPELLPQQSAPPGGGVVVQPPSSAMPLAAIGGAPTAVSAASATGNSSSSKFSDDDDDFGDGLAVAMTSAAVAGGAGHVSDALPYKPFVFVDENETLDDLEQLMSRLGNDIALAIRQIAVASESEQRCQHVDDVIRRYQSLLDSDDAVAESTADVIAALPTCLLSSLRQLLVKSPLPSLTPSPEQIEDSLSAAHFVIFHSICNTNSNEGEDDPARSSLIALVANMAAKQGRVIAHFLYFLAAKQADFGKQAEQLIRDLAEASANKPSTESYLMGCLEFCQQTDPQLFVYLLPFLYAHFKAYLFNGSSSSSMQTTDGGGGSGSSNGCEHAAVIRLLRLTVQVCDSRQLSYLTSHILLHHLAFFTDANACVVLSATLAWETIEQMFAWQLFFAHSNIQPTRLLPIVAKLKPDRHHEALVSLCIRFAMLPPTADMLAAIFARSPSASEFAVPSLFKAWADNNAERLVESLSQVVIASGNNLQQQQQLNSGGNSRLQRGGLAGLAGRSGRFNGATISRNQVLAHLDRFRQTAQDSRFLLIPPVQRLLHSVHQQATENTKNKYSDLFSLIDERLVNDQSNVFAAGSHHGNTSGDTITSTSSSSSSHFNKHTSTTTATTTNSLLSSNNNINNSNSSGNSSSLSVLSLLNSVASDGTASLPRLGGVSSLSSAASKLRRVQKRSPQPGSGSGGPSSQFLGAANNASGRQSAGSPFGGSAGDLTSAAPKMAKFSSAIGFPTD